MKHKCNSSQKLRDSGNLRNQGHKFEKIRQHWREQNLNFCMTHTEIRHAHVTTDQSSAEWRHYWPIITLPAILILTVLRNKPRLAYRNLLAVNKLAESGTTLVFVTYPDALDRMPVAWVWCMLFFFMLFLLGIDTEVRWIAHLLLWMLIIMNIWPLHKLSRLFFCVCLGLYSES